MYMNAIHSKSTLPNWRAHMIKNIFLAAVLTVSAFAATHAQAATGQSGQAGFVSGGGSYEFTVSCVQAGLRPYSRWCAKMCDQFSGPQFAYCNQSYVADKRTSNTRKQGLQSGFVQGNFRSR
jgi:hypothetical protein